MFIQEYFNIYGSESCAVIIATLHSNHLQNTHTHNLVADGVRSVCTHLILFNFIGVYLVFHV